MLAFTLLEEIGVLAGVIIFALFLLVILRPLTFHIILRHEESEAQREAQELVDEIIRQHRKQEEE
jgi:hypothetical protein